MLVNLLTSIPLSKLNACGMGLNDLLHEDGKCNLARCLSLLKFLVVNILVMLIPEMKLNDGLSQEGICLSTGSHLLALLIVVIFDRLE